MAQISTEYGDSEFKWVNYMDEVLEIWEDLCGLIIKKLIDEAARDILSLLWLLFAEKLLIKSKSTQTGWVYGGEMELGWSENPDLFFCFAVWK